MLSFCVRATQRKYVFDSAADTVIAHWPAHVGSTPILASAGQPLSFENCSFVRQGGDEERNASQDTTSADGAVIGSQEGADIRLEGCDFQDSSQDNLLMNFSPDVKFHVFFSDANRTVVNSNGSLDVTQTLPEATAAFLRADDTKLQWLREVRCFGTCTLQFSEMRMS
jgi:hypothetical protein